MQGERDGGRVNITLQRPLFTPLNAVRRDSRMPFAFSRLDIAGDNVCGDTDAHPVEPTHAGCANRYSSASFQPSRSTSPRKFWHQYFYDVERRFEDVEPRDWPDHS